MTIKQAASAAALRRAARKLVFKNKSVRQRVPELMPHGGVDTKAHAQVTERLRAELARRMNSTGDDYLSHISKGRIKDLEALIASGKRPVLGQEALTRQAKGKENMRAWIQDAKAQALNEGKPREWRKYLPRKEITALRIDKKKLLNKRKEFDGAADRIKKIRESGEGMRADDIREARDSLGSHLLGKGEGHFDPIKGKVIMEGFAEATPEVRAATALHEFNELAETGKYLRKGMNFEDVVTTDRVFGYGNRHANATLPVRDLNIARTATGKNADNLRETFENLRAGELHKMKEKMPTLRPMLKQLEGRGVAYGSRAPSKTVMRAQAILDSGKGSPQLKRRAQKIVSTYKASQMPNVRLNRREIKHVRDTYNNMFMKKAALYQRDLVKEAGRKKRPRIALVRGSLGGDESVSNASANAYAKALRAEGYDIDEINLSDVPFADEWDSEYKDKHRALLSKSDATVFATPVYNWGPSARVNAYLQNAVKAGQDPYRPYTVLGAAGSQRSQGYLTSLQNSLAMEDKGINVGAPLVATGEDMEYHEGKLKGVSKAYRKRLKEHAGMLAHLARNRRRGTDG